jgi:hypothetical protein
MEKNDIRCVHTLKQVFGVIELAEPLSLSFAEDAKLRARLLLPSPSFGHAVRQQTVKTTKDGVTSDRPFAQCPDSLHFH